MMNVRWPCSDAPFSKTIRAGFYARRLFKEQLLWASLLALPTAVWTVGLVFAEGPFSTHARVAFAIASSSFAVFTWWLGHRCVWGHLSSLIRRGERSASEWRSSFEAARSRTNELAARLPPTDRSRDPFLRSLAASASASTLRYVLSLSKPADVSFSPRNFAGIMQVGRLREVLAHQLVLELVRLGGSPVVFHDSDENLVAIWQLADVVQFWTVLKVEPFGAELRVSEKTGYQWWVPWTARSKRLGLPIGHRFRAVTKELWDGMDIPWHLSRLPSPPLIVPACVLFAFVFPPIGVACWAWHAFTRARTRARFIRWHNPDLGDSLDLALLQNERNLLPIRYGDWTLGGLVNEDGSPAYPDILQRIETMRELVGAAVTQAIEETVNSPLQHAT